MLYPILNDARAVIDLGGIWRFRLDDGSGDKRFWSRVKFDRTDDPGIVEKVSSTAAPSISKGTGSMKIPISAGGGWTRRSMSKTSH